MSDLRQAAQAALNALLLTRNTTSEHCDAQWGAIHALRAALEAAEKAEPVAYRLEIRWRNRALDQSWRKYADTAYRDRAISWRDSANNMETESRIVPLYAGEPEESR